MDRPAKSKAKMAFSFSKNFFKRGLLHLCILLGVVSIIFEKSPTLLNQEPIKEDSVQIEATSEELLAEAISESQEKPSVLKPQVSIHEPIDSFEALSKLDLYPRATQLVQSLASDKLALWSVFSHLSTYTELVEILNQPIKAFERETLRSESFGIASGFDQIIYRIHHTSGATSLLVAEVSDDSVSVSLYRAPKEMGQAFRVQKFKDGMWTESKELLSVQVEEEFYAAKKGSSVVLSASVGL
jgi:hypothetical protein